MPAQPRRAAIIGGSAGIGLATAELLAAHGAEAAITALAGNGFITGVVLLCDGGLRLT
jgi:NAD(P)-dependent dehydrogenase (short-subunit alcohol dehydrogenase family)